ncbi:ATP-dependent DNA ligase [Pseudonocardia spinosispora]|uniref:ATP-dependent DNA ligase n=1 Tax=Pseudonocardia spinosispora TaxID=103441 RepID=UPI000426363C|nr:ATP-dependent DNA ligase [Pseudonocardia spinosispora]
MLLAQVVDVSAAVAATRSRKAKVQSLAGLLSDLAPDEIEPAVAWLSGEPRQGRLGTGWRTLSALKVEPAEQPATTVAELDITLTELVGTSGAGSAKRRTELLTTVFSGATADEQQFLFRLFTGELRQGALEGVLTEAVAAASGVASELVRRGFMLSGSLPATARAALLDGTEAVAAFRLEVGRGVRPMLASPASTLDDAVAELGAVTVEYKLDGARIQVHRDGEDVHVFTRSLRDITAKVPELVELVRALPCRSVVLDGESLALTDDGRPRPFQETMSNASSGTLAPRFFDCLHLDGTDLLDVPLRERLAALTEVVGDLRMPGVLDATAEQAAQVLDDSLGAGHEGVMVKALDSVYAAGRRGKSWQKVKPVHTLDLVVLGVEWGYGRRTGMLSNIHLGARDPDGGAPVMVGKTFKGMTDALLTWQTEQFSARALHDDGHVVTLPPEFVVEIGLDGVQTSTRYPGGVALRFARVIRYRPDKTPADADTITAVRALLA